MRHYGERRATFVPFWQGAAVICAIVAHVGAATFVPFWQGTAPRGLSSDLNGADALRRTERHAGARQNRAWLKLFVQNQIYLVS